MQNTNQNPKKMKLQKLWIVLLILGWLLPACQTNTKTIEEPSEMQKKVNEFALVKLQSDLFDQLSENQQLMIGELFDATAIMDDLFWKQAFGDKEALFSEVEDPAVQEFLKINYGPWERLKGNQPFMDSYGPKPPGAQFYPPDMTKEEFEAFEDPSKTSLYTMIRRNENGQLVSIPYHDFFGNQLNEVAQRLLKAAEYAEDPGFKKYLELRSEALATGDYLASDMAWMDMKDNSIDLVIGPIENYEDGLYGYKAAFEGYILLKDKEWSKRLSRFSSLLPELQKSLPVSEEYKQETPGSDSDLGVYDVIYYAGDCNAGSKTIAINLPNDERVQLEKGSRKLQLKNAMRYKFDQILVPISNLMMAEDQRQYITFDAFFENTMFHEVAHGLGIKNTINGQGSVRTVLKEQYSALEEGKADILGLYLVTKLAEMGELGEKDLMDNYVTFMAGIFRSVRFGVASSHGKANMIRFYYFQEKGAFTRDDASGTYRIDFDKMQAAMNDLANEILTIQGNGNYDAATQMVEDMGYIREALQADLDRISDAGIPRDIRFQQGKTLFGLE